MHVAVLLEKQFIPHGSETTWLHQLDEFNDVALENLLEEEKSNVVQFNDENEDEISLKDSKSSRMVARILHLQREGVQRNDHLDQ